MRLTRCCSSQLPTTTGWRKRMATRRWGTHGEPPSFHSTSCLLSLFLPLSHEAAAVRAPSNRGLHVSALPRLSRRVGAACAAGAVAAATSASGLIGCRVSGQFLLGSDKTAARVGWCHSRAAPGSLMTASCSLADSPAPRIWKEKYEPGASDKKSKKK